MEKKHITKKIELKEDQEEHIDFPEYLVSLVDEENFSPKILFQISEVTPILLYASLRVDIENPKKRVVGLNNSLDTFLNKIQFLLDEAFIEDTIKISSLAKTVISRIDSPVSAIKDIIDKFELVEKFGLPLENSLPLINKLERLMFILSHYSPEFPYNNKSNSDIEKSPSEEIPQTKNPSHKVVLLHELGIIELLKTRLKKNGIEDNTNLARLIGSVLGLTKKTEIDNLRKTLSYLGTRENKNPINNKSKSEVTSLLVKYGIKIENL